MFSTFQPRTLLVPLVVVIVACGGDDNDNGDPTDPGGGATFGTFSLQITGNRQLDLSGNAVFGSADGNFILALVAEDGRGLTIQRISGGRPAPGTLPVGDATNELVGVVLLGGGDPGYLITSGTLTVTSSSANRLEGSLSMQGTHSSGTGSIALTGSFRALCPEGTGACQ